MITEEILKSKYANIARELYKKVFHRDLSQEELDERFKGLFSRMNEDLKVIRGFTDAQFERYMSAKGNEILLSPRCVYEEIYKLIQGGREDELERSGKYKMLREMELACRFCFANYKLRGEMFMIKPQDSPDITLALMGSKSKEIEMLHMEIMAIPETAKNNMVGELPVAITNFIKDKKFLKDYGRCSLLVCLDFDFIGLNYDKIAEGVSLIPNNPFESIWLAFVTDQEGGMAVIKIHPGVLKIEYNLRKEDLFY